MNKPLIHQKPDIDLRHLLTPSKFIPTYLARRDAQGGLAPFSVELHLSSSCNYQCLHCSYARRNRVGHKRLSRETVRRTLSDLAAMRPAAAYFSGGGDPTLLPGWGDYVLELSEAGTNVALVTNGSLLDKAPQEVLHALSYLAVSVYSPRREIYDTVTSGGHFDGQFAVSSYFGGERRTVVGARCVINQYNVDHVFDVYATAMASGFDYIIFIPEVDYEHRGLTLSPDELAVLRDGVAAHRDEIDPARTNLLPLSQRDFSYYSQASECGSTCFAVRLRTNAFINYDGEVYLCQPLIGQKEYSIGNVEDARLPELWNGDRHELVAKRLTAEYPLEACGVCRCRSYNTVVDEYEGLAPNEPFTLVKDCFI